MLELEFLNRAFAAGRVMWSRHAEREAAMDRIDADEALASIKTGEILKQYPDDRPYPSCLTLGFTPSGEPLHIVVGLRAYRRRVGGAPAGPRCPCSVYPRPVVDARH